MGAWGYGPFDNDTALDFSSEIEEPISRAVKRKPADHNYYELIASAEIIVALSKLYNQNEEIIDSLVQGLENILKDIKFIHSWNDPKKFTKSVKKTMSKLKKLQ